MLNVRLLKAVISIAAPLIVLVALFGGEVPWQATGWGLMPWYRYCLPILYTGATGLAAAIARRLYGITWKETIVASVLAAVIVLLAFAPWLLHQVAQVRPDPYTARDIVWLDRVKWIVVQAALAAIGPFWLMLLDRATVPPEVAPKLWLVFVIGLPVIVISGAYAYVVAAMSDGCIDAMHTTLIAGILLSLVFGGVSLLVTPIWERAGAGAGIIAVISPPLMVLSYVVLILWLLLKTHYPDL